MAQKITRKSMKQDEFIEVAFDAGQWIENHWRTAAAFAGAALAIVLIGAGWNWRRGRNVEEVENLLSQGLALYNGQAGGGDRVAESVSLFERAEQQGRGIGPGWVAAYYHGAALVKLGRAADAAAVLERVANEAGDRTVADSARAVLAEAYARAGDVDRAVATYRRLAETPGGTYPADMALLQSGKLLRDKGKSQEARQTWQDLLAKYPQGGAAAEARSLLQEAAPARERAQ